MRTSAPAALACSRLRREPGTRIASPNVVKITSGRSAIATQSSTHAHRQHADRAARAVHELEGLRQQFFEAVAEDRMRVAAAHFHDLQRPGALVHDALGENVDALDHRACLDRIAEFVDVFHALLPDGPRLSASSVCTRSQRMW